MRKLCVKLLGASHNCSIVRKVRSAVGWIPEKTGQANYDYGKFQDLFCFFLDLCRAVTSAAGAVNALSWPLEPVCWAALGFMESCRSCVMVVLSTPTGLGQLCPSQEIQVAADFGVLSVTKVTKRANQLSARGKD